MGNVEAISSWEDKGILCRLEKTSNTSFLDVVLPTKHPLNTSAKFLAEEETKKSLEKFLHATFPKIDVHSPDDEPVNVLRIWIESHPSIPQIRECLEPWIDDFIRKDPEYWKELYGYEILPKDLVLIIISYLSLVLEKNSFH